MKRIFLALILLAAAFTVSASELGYISAKADSFESMIELADKHMMKNNFEEAIGLCSKIENEWYDSSKSIDTLLIHDYVDAIGGSISKMRSYAQSGSPDMYFAESTNAKKELASIRESEYPFIENIL